MMYRIAYAACRGTYHIQKDVPCQDAVAGAKEENSAVVVLSDGAGSCQYAGLGAKTVVDTMVRYLLEHATSCEADEDLRGGIIDTCINALSINGVPLKEQASTLLFSVVNQNGEYLCGHIGDGYIFLCSEEEVSLLSDAENGETSTETFFVTSPQSYEHLRLITGTLAPGEAVVLCSDGAGEGLYDRKNGLCAPAVGEIVRWLSAFSEEEVTQALHNNLDELFRENSHDDMSLAILMREEYSQSETTVTEQMGEEE